MVRVEPERELVSVLIKKEQLTELAGCNRHVKEWKRAEVNSVKALFCDDEHSAD
jgi:hypothetical protein